MSQRLYIRVISGAQTGRKFSLEDEGEFLLGRAPSCDICLPDNSVSGSHAILQCNGQGDGRQWFIVDQNSRNGTTLNGVRLGPAPVLLPANGTLGIANVQVQFWTEPSQSLSTPPPRPVEDGRRTQNVQPTPVPPPALHSLATSGPVGQPMAPQSLMSKGPEPRGGSVRPTVAFSEPPRKQPGFPSGEPESASQSTGRFSPPTPQAPPRGISATGTATPVRVPSTLSPDRGDGAPQTDRTSADTPIPSWQEPVSLMDLESNNPYSRTPLPEPARGTSSSGTSNPATGFGGRFDAQPPAGAQSVWNNPSLGTSQPVPPVPPVQSTPPAKGAGRAPSLPERNADIRNADVRNSDVRSASVWSDYSRPDKTPSSPFSEAPPNPFVSASAGASVPSSGSGESLLPSRPPSGPQQPILSSSLGGNLERNDELTHPHTDLATPESLLEAARLDASRKEPTQTATSAYAGWGGWEGSQNAVPAAPPDASVVHRLDPDAGYANTGFSTPIAPAESNPGASNLEIIDEPTDDPWRVPAGLPVAPEYPEPQAPSGVELQKALEAQTQLRSELERRTQELARAQEELTRLKQSLQQTQQQVQQGAQQEVAQARQELAQSRQETLQLRQEHQQLRQEYQQLQGEVGALRKEGPRLHGDMGRLQSELQRFQGEYQRIQGDMQRAQGEFQRLAQEHTAMRQQLIERAQEIEGLRARLTSTQQALQDAETALRSTGRTGPDPTSHTLFRQAVAFSDSFGQGLEALALTLAAGTDPLRARQLLRDISLQLGDMRSLLEEGKRVSGQR